MDDTKVSKPDHPIRRLLKEEGRTWLMAIVIVTAYFVIMGH